MPDFEIFLLARIARRAGVSRNAYYRNYGCKEEILDNFLCSIVTESVEEMLRFDPISQTFES